MEVDEPFHTAERRVEKQERFDAERCYETRNEVVQEFFKMIEIGYS